MESPWIWPAFTAERNFPEVTGGVMLGCLDREFSILRWWRIPGVGDIDVKSLNMTAWL